MRNERTQLELNAGGEQSVVHLLTQLMKQRVPVTDARPDHVPVAALRETTDAFDAEHEWFHAHPAQRIRDRIVSGGRLLPDETNREVDLLRRRPLHAGDFSLQLRQKNAQGSGWMEGDKETSGRSHELTWARKPRLVKVRCTH
jgi:hypothetical protein